MSSSLCYRGARHHLPFFYSDCIEVLTVTKWMLVHLSDMYSILMAIFRQTCFTDSFIFCICLEGACFIKLSYIFLDTIFRGHSVCLVLSTLIVIQCMTQSTSGCSAYSNHLMYKAVFWFCRVCHWPDLPVIVNKLNPAVIWDLHGRLLEPREKMELYVLL